MAINENRPTITYENIAVFCSAESAHNSGSNSGDGLSFVPLVQAADISFSVERKSVGEIGSKALNKQQFLSAPDVNFTISKGETFDQLFGHFFPQRKTADNFNVDRNFYLYLGDIKSEDVMQPSGANELKLSLETGNDFVSIGNCFLNNLSIGQSVNGLLTSRYSYVGSNLQAQTFNYSEETVYFNDFEHLSVGVKNADGGDLDDSLGILDVTDELGGSESITVTDGDQMGGGTRSLRISDNGVTYGIRFSGIPTDGIYMVSGRYKQFNNTDLKLRFSTDTNYDTNTSIVTFNPSDTTSEGAPFSGSGTCTTSGFIDIGLQGQTSVTNALHFSDITIKRLEVVKLDAPSLDLTGDQSQGIKAVLDDTKTYFNPVTGFNDTSGSTYPKMVEGFRFSGSAYHFTGASRYKKWDGFNPPGGFSIESTGLSGAQTWVSTDVVRFVNGAVQQPNVSYNLIHLTDDFDWVVTRFTSGSTTVSGTFAGVGDPMTESDLYPWNASSSFPFDEFHSAVPHAISYNTDVTISGSGSQGNFLIKSDSIQSFDLNLPINRKPIYSMGKKYAVKRKPLYPSEGSFSFSNVASSFEISGNRSNLKDFLNFDEDYDVSITFNQNPFNRIISIESAKLSSENLNSAIGSNMDSSLSFTFDLQNVETSLEIKDSDGDGLSDFAETNTHGTDPLDADSDNDGMTDGYEVDTYGTDPNFDDSAVTGFKVSGIFGNNGNDISGHFQLSGVQINGKNAFISPTNNHQIYSSGYVGVPSWIYIDGDDNNPSLLKFNDDTDYPWNGLPSWGPQTPIFYDFET